MFAAEVERAPGAPSNPVIHVGGPARELMRALTLRFFRHIHTRRRAYTINVKGKRLWSLRESSRPAISASSV